MAFCRAVVGTAAIRQRGKEGDWGGGIRSCTSKYDTALRVCLLGVCVCDAVKYERV